MKQVKIKRELLYWGLMLSLPLLLVAVFQLAKGHQDTMDWWVFKIMAPLEQALGRGLSWIPFSVAEVLTALFLAGNVLWVIFAGISLLKRRNMGGLLRRMLALAAAWLWLWAGFCWLWNASYYAATFTQRSGIEVSGYSVEQLRAVTRYFAQNAARLAKEMPRDGQGGFDGALEDYFQTGVTVYKAIEQEFPVLAMHSVQAKPLFFSRLQSVLGFTGIYFPFTGEANVNVDAPACLVPATIAHEMAHQRMVASELEANFVGIAASISSQAVPFQYSGYFMGLIQLCNALYPLDSEGWNTIVRECFNPQLVADWQENNDYWAALESPVEAVAGQAYDAFLKGNGQSLGIQSYGACVDLLIAYYGNQAEQLPF